VAFPIPVAGTISGLYARKSATGGRDFTYTLRINGADTVFSCTVTGGSATACSKTGVTQAVAAGDYAALKVVGGSGGGGADRSITWSIVITP
jgi:hypothetical protein